MVFSISVSQTRVYKATVTLSLTGDAERGNCECAAAEALHQQQAQNKQSPDWTHIPGSQGTTVNCLRSPQAHVTRHTYVDSYCMFTASTLSPRTAISFIFSSPNRFIFSGHSSPTLVRVGSSTETTNFLAVVAFRYLKTPMNDF